MKRSFFLVPALLAATLAACGGGEDGEGGSHATMAPGGNCMRSGCHGNFSVAGTVFPSATSGASAGLANLSVVVTDGKQCADHADQQQRGQLLHQPVDGLAFAKRLRASQWHAHRHVGHPDGRLCRMSQPGKRIGRGLRQPSLCHAPRNYLRAGGRSVQLPCATSAAMPMLSPSVGCG